ncbi:MAG: hypothetical protein PG981_000364 [Wolbachia endosymbiont of Ctenocephalides orientis wCori]|nr:MAG: hypothetical protein PG981_000364 [Wolbachia endosymbiont of Ctenocephalides orientis wCori]
MLDWFWGHASNEQSALFNTKDYDNTLGEHSSDEVVKWFLDHASDGKIRLDILKRSKGHVLIWNRIINKFGSRVIEDILTALESDGAEKELAEQIIGKIVSSDDIEALNLLWNSTKEPNKQANILNVNNYYSNFKEAVRLGHIRILDWILEHISKINIPHQNMLQSSEYGVVSEITYSGNTEVLEWVWKYAYAIGGNEEQKKC